MANTREQRSTAAQRMRKKLQQKIGLGRTALLLILAVSLLNQLLLLLKVNYHFLFSASVPYCLNWLARKLGGAAGVTPLKVIAVIVTLAVYVLYIACWLFSARRREFLKTALLLYCADTVLLVIFAFALLNNPFSCLFELLIHLVGILLLYQAYQAAQQLRKMKKRKSSPAPVPEDESLRAAQY
jgi:hypothetical protein